MSCPSTSPADDPFTERPEEQAAAGPRVAVVSLPEPLPEHTLGIGIDPGLFGAVALVLPQWSTEERRENTALNEWMRRNRFDGDDPKSPDSHAMWVCIWDTPTIEGRTAAGKNRTAYEPDRMRAVIDALCAPVFVDARPLPVALELPSVRPGESGQSALTIGIGWGVWYGLLLAHPTVFDVRTVASAGWKANLTRRHPEWPELPAVPTIKSGATAKEREQAQARRKRLQKDRSLAVARATWPNDARLFARQRDNGRAEAALLALQVAR